MAFATQSTVAFGDTWSATQHNVMINNDIWVNTAFHVNLFPNNSGLAPSSGLTASALSQVQSSGAGTIKPEYWILSHDAGTDEGRIWTARVPRGFGSTLTIVGAFYMASATSGNVVVAAQVACQSDGDATFSAKVFATENSSTVAVPGSAGTVKYFTITMTNNDSIAASDWIDIAFRRDADNASDTATGDMQLVLLDLFYSMS